MAITTPGYNGKILRVNLSNKSTETEEIDEQFCRRYLGGAGFIVYYLWKELKAGIPETRTASGLLGVDPLSRAARDPAAAPDPGRRNWTGTRLVPGRSSQITAARTRPGSGHAGSPHRRDRRPVDGDPGADRRQPDLREAPVGVGDAFPLRRNVLQPRPLQPPRMSACSAAFAGRMPSSPVASRCAVTSNVYRPTPRDTGTVNDSGDPNSPSERRGRSTTPGCSRPRSSVTTTRSRSANLRR